MKARFDLLLLIPPLVSAGLAWCAAQFAAWWGATFLFCLGSVSLGSVVSLGIWQRKAIKTYLDKIWPRDSRDKTPLTEEKNEKEPEYTKKKEDEYATVRFAIIWGVVLFLLVSGLWLTFGMAPYLRTGHQNFQAHEFGDSFGFVNTWFSGLAFAGVILAIILQTIELKQQRKELELSVAAHQETAQALLISTFTDAILAYEAAWRTRNDSLAHRNSYMQIQSIVNQLSQRAGECISLSPDINHEEWGHILIDEIKQTVDLYLPTNCNPASISAKQVSLVNKHVRKWLPISLGLINAPMESQRKMLAIAKDVEHHCTTAIENASVERAMIEKAIRGLHTLRDQMSPLSR